MLRNLHGSDGALFLLTLGWAAIGGAANYFRVRGLATESSLCLMFVTIIVWPSIAGIIAYSVFRRQRRPADYGLSFQRGSAVSLALLALIHAYLAISGKLTLHANASFAWSALGAFMEELCFRSIAIQRLILLMHGIKGKALWAIVGSSVLWSLPHIPSKSPGQLLGGIFLGGLLFGFLYYKSGSIVLPAWIHGVANAGYLGGISVVLLCVVTSTTDYAIASRNKQIVRAVSARTIT